MDYKYIEQLLERYWAAETSPEEENILKAFFNQHDVPAKLQVYADLFRYIDAEAEVVLGNDFDTRVLQAAGLGESSERPAEVHVFKAHQVRKPIGLRPLFQAAAAVAVVVLISIGAQRLFSPAQQGDASWDYNPDSYSDTYATPTQAYHVVESGLELFQKTASADTTSLEQKSEEPKTEAR